MLKPNNRMLQIAAISIAVEQVLQDFFAHQFNTQVSFLLYFAMDVVVVFFISTITVSFIKSIIVDKEKRYFRHNFWGIASGLISCIGVLCFLQGSREVSPGIAITLFSGQILYVAVWQVIRGKVPLARIWWSILLILGGAGLVGFDSSMHGSLNGILFIIGPADLCLATGELIGEYGIKKSRDETNFTLMHLGTTAFVGIAIVYFFSPSSFTSVLPSIVPQQLFVYCGLLILVGILACIEVLVKFTAKKDNTTIEVLIRMALTIAVGFLLTYAGHRLMDGIFGYVTDNPLWLFVNVVGAALICIGSIFSPKPSTPKMLKTQIQ